MEEDKQLDLFGNFRENAEIIYSIHGIFIGRFTDNSENPVQRLSRYYKFDDEERAEADLRAGFWDPPTPE